MTDATIFDGDSQQTAAPAAPENILNALVGENQKYKTPEELAKAYANADTFIEQLKAENRELREKTAKAKTLDEVLEGINKRQPEQQEDSPAITTKEVDVPKLVEEMLEQREAAKKQTENLRKADEAMRAKYGDKAKDVFASLADTDHMRNTLMSVAAENPDKFVALFSGVQLPEQGGNVMDAGSVTTSVVATSNRETTPGTKEWASKIRKDEPTKYWSHKFQLELQQMAVKNPNLYFGN